MRVILEKRGRLGRPAGWRDVMAEKKQSAADKKAAGDKKSALETALAQIEKQFGKGAVMKLG